MAGENGPQATGVNYLERLRKEPHKFNFYQAVRRLESIYRHKPRLGRSLRPADDAVRLAQEPSLSFAPATLAALEPAKGERPPRLFVRFAGLFGPNGPLPLHLTEYARDRIFNARDFTMARFLDIFHHRMLSLFYRAWADAQPTVQFDRPETDRFATYIGAAFGMGMPALRNRDSANDLAKLFFAGRLACPTRHPEGLAALLNEYFQLPMRIEEFVGHWLRLPENCRCELRLGSQTASLGLSTTIGERVWDCQQKFHIVAGPMRFADYERLLPGGASLQSLISLVRLYAGLELSWEVHLVLKKEETPPLTLGCGSRLGWTTWLTSKTPENDPADLVLNPFPQPQPA